MIKPGEQRAAGPWEGRGAGASPREALPAREAAVPSRRGLPPVIRATHTLREINLNKMTQEG